MRNGNDPLEEFKISDEPNYINQKNEEKIFMSAIRTLKNNLSIFLKYKIFLIIKFIKE